MYPHGNSDKNLVDCQYMVLTPLDYMIALTLSWTEAGGINQVSVESSDGQVLTVGAQRARDNQTKTFKFDKRHQLMGLKGLGRDNSIDSLGLIMFDATCNIDDPDGAPLAVPTFEPKKEPEPEPEPVPEEPEEKVEVVIITPEIVPEPEVAKEDKTDTMTIILYSVGGMAGLILLIVAIHLICMKCSKKNKKKIE